jgi:peptidyl-prolyl cis-trans isomerase NIMA-interacting 1
VKRAAALPSALLVVAAVAALACGSTAPPAHAPEAIAAETAPSSAPATSAAATPVTSASAAPSSSPSAANAKGLKIGARHVLIQWDGCQRAGSQIVRTRDQAYSVAEEVLRRAKAGEDFARLAVEYSDEPNAASRGGSLGVFPRGQMVKAFDDAAFALKPGEISGIVETSFGFHVILRTE